MVFKRFCRVLIVVWLVLTLASCTAITRKIQQVGNTCNSSYPAAPVSSPELEKQVVINLAAYKSVHTRKSKHGDFAIALAASGGGYRAANLTLGVLLGLESLQSKRLGGNLLQEVDYYSSVSGGGFGVGYYLTQLHNHLIKYGNIEQFSLKSHVNAMLARDHVMTNPLRIDLTELLFFGKNRRFQLEQKINELILKTPEGGLCLGDMFVPKNTNDEVQLPYWVTNSTIFQNAALLPFTPDVLTHYRVSGYFHEYMQYSLRGQFDNPYYAFPVPVAVGLTASSSVPFATPATTLISDSCKDKCYLQLLDGGLADNLGVYTALNLLLQDKSKVKILIIVDASKASTQPYSQSMEPPQSSALLWRVMTVITDANRGRIKSNIHLVSREILSGRGATNVIVVYLDLSHYPEARRIGTQLCMTPQAQRMLLDIGRKLVTENPTIQTLMKEIEEGKITLGQCRRVI